MKILCIRMNYPYNIELSPLKKYRIKSLKKIKRNQWGEISKNNWIKERRAYIKNSRIRNIKNLKDFLAKILLLKNLSHKQSNKIPFFIISRSSEHSYDSLSFLYINNQVSWTKSFNELFLSFFWQSLSRNLG